MKQNVRALRRFLTGLKVRLGYKARAEQGQKGYIFIDLEEIVFERYFYLFVKFFVLEGYRVVISPRIGALAGLATGGYSRYVLKERLVEIDSSPGPACLLEFSDRPGATELSADYFTGLADGQPLEGAYYVPMAMHPNIYHETDWERPYHQPVRKRAVFFAGNFDQQQYTAIRKEDKFDVVDRLELAELMLEHLEVFRPESMEQMRAMPDDLEVVLAQYNAMKVPIPELRETLSQYRFFLACPGVVMPFSHNVIEAMSVGCIPVIQENYAKMFLPALEDGVNAFLFLDAASFIPKMREVVGLDPTRTALMSDNVRSYYAKYLTPRSVVEHLVKGGYKKVFLNAEYISVAQYRKA